MDLDKVEQFRKSIADIQQRVSFNQFNIIIRTKMIDFIANNPDASIDEVNTELKEIFGPQWTKYVNMSIQRYDEIVQVVNAFYPDVGPDISRDIQQIISIEKINKTRLGEYSPRMLKRLQKVTRQSMKDKQIDFNTYKSRLKLIGGRVETYADVLARTQIKGYSRELKHVKANLGEVFFYEYVGFIRETTRQFCRDRLNNTSPRDDNTYHVDEINNLDNGPKQLKPVITYCGGWNCRHDWEPDPFYKG